MRIFGILFLLGYCGLSYSQLVDKSKFDRLVIVDRFNSNYSIQYGRVYKISLQDSLYYLMLTKEYKSPDSLPSRYQRIVPDWNEIEKRELYDTISKIDPHLINDLIKTINRPKSLSSVFDYYGIDSCWHSDNKDRLICKWLSIYDYGDKAGIEYAKTVLSDFEQFKRIAYSHILQSNTSGYSSVTIAFESDTDTLLIHTTGQESFLLPWKSDKTYANYDPRLSWLVSQFLPNDLVINKASLSPVLEEFENGILDQLSFNASFVKYQSKDVLKKENR